MGTRISTGILLVAGFVLILVRPGGLIVMGLLIAIAGAVRVYGLRRGKLRFAPWQLTIIALMMPEPAARAYLEELGHSAGVVRGRERRRHVWHAIVASPGTLVTVWHGWLRGKLVRLAAWALVDRVHQVQSLLWDARCRRVALRRLRRYCRLILCATGGGQYHEFAGPARVLLLSCRESAENGGSAELDARIRQEVEKLLCVLANRRPDLA